ncbi:MAG TPA: hypothetical protein VNZ86_17095, partial [Bacteroidia bacterium]|nr:hypothetical protein [Bacteroidia bacterium]
NLDLVPVVYITNEALIHLSDTAVPLLSERLLNRMKHIFLTTGALKLKEVQLDCDWTGETKDKYFSLIRALKEKVHARGITLSTTIRLHQIKYFARTGVPPADRGMLMFYNMGKVDDIHTANSIYDASTASRYLVNFTTYPLPLDIALPCFSWAVVFRESHIAALLSNKAKTDLDQEEGLERTDATHYRVKHEFKIGTVSLTPEETVRLEQVDPELCDKAAQQIAPFLRDQELYVSVFQLKKNQPDIHEKKILDQIYCRFK